MTPGSAPETDANPGADPGAEAATPTNLVDLIDGLIEPGAPPPVPMAPQTWGWAALALLVAALALWLALRWRAAHRANAYRRAALAASEQATSAAEHAAILRRAALAAYPRTDVAGLIGQDWIAFLDRTGQAGLSAAAAEELLAAPYRAETAASSPDLAASVGRWLRTHRADAPPRGGVAPETSKETA